MFQSSIVILAQELPPIEKYLPETYKGQTQNWSISQAGNKYIYVGNNQGLLEFNGEKWIRYTTPNNTPMRSVKVVKDRIYTGFYMNFGYWEKNIQGKLKYTSLSDKIKDKIAEDEEFWDIEYQDDRVLFQSLSKIYIYNTVDEEFNVITAENRILGIFDVNGTIFYQDLYAGVFKIEKGKSLLITDFDVADNDKIVCISKHKNGLLFLTKNKGFFEVSNTEVYKKNIAADTLLNTVTIYSSDQLNDGSFVLGTISNGFIHLSKSGEVISQIDQTKGLSNNTVLSIYEDIDGNVWLGLDNGINCINIKSPIKIFNDDEGRIGTVYTSTVFEDFLFLGTNQGLFYRKINKEEPFRFIKGTDGQVWNLYIYDNTLFCGHNSGTYVIKNQTAKLISNIQGGWNFKPLANYPNKLLQGTYTGLSILEKQNDSWILKNKIRGFDYSARFLEIFKNEIWINHEYKGVFRVKTDDQFLEVKKISKDTLLQQGSNSNLIEYEQKIVYGHETGISVYNDKKNIFEKISEDSEFFNIKDAIQGKVLKDNKGGVWCFSKDYLGYIYHSQFSEDLKINKIPIPRSLRKEMPGFENITNTTEDKYLIGTTFGYIILDLAKIEFTKHHVVLDQVEVRDKDSEFNLVSLSDTPSVFKSNLNTISFSYTVPEYDKFIVSEFQYILEGFNDHWSDWSNKSNVVFENLPFGNYTFRVRAKTGDELNDKEISYQFEIDRPWYFSTWLIIVYVIIFLIIIIVVHRSYKRYYTKQKKKLLEQNRKELEMKQLESEKEIIKLNNEKLRQDIESKNRELASSTMNIIKKNELLNTIKKELKKSESEKSGLRNVELIIDKNLNNEDDWKHVEEAFNNLDKDFLKKLKEKHLDLTPHDLRFCTYLRLNLSSKEIAPLLNISVRSVEIKRYRLRKKLKLKHSDSLVSYILEI